MRTLMFKPVDESTSEAAPAFRIDYDSEADVLYFSRALKSDFAVSVAKTDGVTITNFSRTFDDCNLSEVRAHMGLSVLDDPLISHALRIAKKESRLIAQQKRAAEVEDLKKRFEFEKKIGKNKDICLALRNAGATLDQIAMMMGLQRQTVQYHLQEVVPYTGNYTGQLPDKVARAQDYWERRQRILNAYRSGAKLSEIARKIGVSRETVKAHLAKQCRGWRSPIENYFAETGDIRKIAELLYGRSHLRSKGG